MARSFAIWPTRRFRHPPLTTVALPHYEMGAWATAKNLIDAIEGKTDLALLVDHPTVLGCPLVIRNSVTDTQAPGSTGHQTQAAF